MQVEFDEDVRKALESAGGDLQIQSMFIPKKDLEERYLNPGLGNSYNVNQLGLQLQPMINNSYGSRFPARHSTMHPARHPARHSARRTARRTPGGGPPLSFSRYIYS
jgi:hypothetical protein